MAAEPRGQEGSPRPVARLAFLEGLRGAAAGYVVLHHAALAVAPTGMGGLALAARFLLRHGHFAVAVFIVVSGYCLMLPVALDPERRLRGGTRGFLLRRARRILPPYYAALALCCLLIGLLPALGRPDRSRWDRALPAFGPGTVAAHLALVHNLSARWFHKIDPPLWSVATEWQIYLLFPALLAIWRRLGIVAAVSAGFGLGYAVAALAVPLRNPALRDLCPWYAGLFASGMAGALASCRRGGRRPDGPDPAERWVAAALVLLALVAGGAAIARPDDRGHTIADPLVGAATVALIVRWARRAEPGAARGRPPSLRLLQSRPMVALGSISYSLYLTHMPLLALADRALRVDGLGPEARLAALTLAASPACLAAAWLFHRTFERPFLPARLRADDAHVDATPAPGRRADQARARALAGRSQREPSGRLPSGPDSPRACFRAE